MRFLFATLSLTNRIEGYEIVQLLVSLSCYIPFHPLKNQFPNLICFCTTHKQVSHRLNCIKAKNSTLSINVIDYPSTVGKLDSSAQQLLTEKKINVSGSQTNGTANDACICTLRQQTAQFCSSPSVLLIWKCITALLLTVILGNS